MPTLSVSQRKKLIEKIQRLTTKKPLSRIDIVKVLVGDGCTEIVAENMLTTLSTYGYLKKTVIRPSDGYNSPLMAYQWVEQTEAEKE